MYVKCMLSVDSHIILDILGTSFIVTVSTYSHTIKWYYIHTVGI